ncbi:MAG: hypothetical protein GXY14_12745 [Spirochaetes bacterium]|nr:hypothetical protein [Spirochaetota bacterium]
MKNFFLTIILSLSLITGLSSSLFAINEYEDEDEYFTYSVYGGYGFGSVLNISTGLLEAIAFSFSAAFTDEARTIEDNGSFGPLFFGADYYFSDNFSAGGIFVYESVNRRWQYDSGYVDWDWTFVSLMGRLNVQYGWDYFKFYHSIMIGGTYSGIDVSSSDGQSPGSSEFIPGVHLALLGIKIGKEFSVFADVGVGWLGIVNFGASFSF